VVKEIMGEYELSADDHLHDLVISPKMRPNTNIPLLFNNLSKFIFSEDIDSSFSNNKNSTFLCFKQYVHPIA
jgi:hypothetical protein